MKGRLPARDLAFTGAFCLVTYCFFVFFLCIHIIRIGRYIKSTVTRKRTLMHLVKTEFNFTGHRNIRGNGISRHIDPESYTALSVTTSYNDVQMNKRSLNAVGTQHNRQHARAKYNGTRNRLSLLRHGNGVPRIPKCTSQTSHTKLMARQQVSKQY